ncbi:hypothetical protein NSZ01_36720 [Nocardioides szechwanensis]|uniref:Aromatic ring-opening dioxygenase LigA n=1 Tax=Nocardioides szechwanensis TaxID=1005944 RepID=A0A1H0FXA8_9ACTN|nr:hypothetical protein [Nocardioides szechwanensis]GEP35904.1 hypothetical protein NSZ01_36720 [Nocardioides szechwanensis]SDN99250.1 hypothetical protein SAMN05192576_3180 [Nocardioides szechwanensis]
MRSTLDKLISGTGLLLAVVLLVAGGLLTWANVFIGDQVEEQLIAQDIVMPEGPALEGLPKADADALKEFGGSPMDSGAEARAYADHFIQAHMNASGEELAGEPLSYSQASAKARELGGALAENPNATQAEIDEAAAWGDLRQSLFMGSTLRGLLLYAFAFATMGVIAGYAAIASFVGAAVLLALGFLGLRHAKKIEDTPTATTRTPVPAGV